MAEIGGSHIRKGWKSDEPDRAPRPMPPQVRSKRQSGSNWSASTATLPNRFRLMAITKYG